MVCCTAVRSLQSHPHAAVKSALAFLSARPTDLVEPSARHGASPEPVDELLGVTLRPRRAAPTDSLVAQVARGPLVDEPVAQAPVDERHAGAAPLDADERPQRPLHGLVDVVGEVRGPEPGRVLRVGRRPHAPRARVVREGEEREVALHRRAEVVGAPVPVVHHVGRGVEPPRADVVEDPLVADRVVEVGVVAARHDRPAVGRGVGPLQAGLEQPPHVAGAVPDDPPDHHLQLALVPVGVIGVGVEVVGEDEVVVDDRTEDGVGRGVVTLRPVARALAAEQRDDVVVPQDDDLLLARSVIEPVLEELVDRPGWPRWRRPARRCPTVRLHQSRARSE